MATPRKTATLAELAEKFRGSDAVFVTEYRGLTVGQLAELRRSLRGTATYSIAKNTLIALAAKEAKVEGLDAHFTGPTAIAFVTGDPVAAAKALRDFGTAHPALVIKGGVFEGKAITAADVQALASLESREVLLAKVAYALMAPVAKAARAFDALRVKQETAA